MHQLYKFLTALVFLYAAGHMAYTFSYKGLATAEAKMWFFSAGLLLLFTGLFHLIQLYACSRFVRRINLLANTVLLAFLLVLSVVVPEVQVLVLDGIILAIIIVAAFCLPARPGSKAQL